MEAASDTQTPLTQSSAQAYGSTTLQTGDSKPNVGEYYAEESEQSMFPFEPFKYLPPSIVGILPGTWTRIVSLPHLVLLIASFSSLAVLIETIASWHAVGCRSDYCEGRITPIVFVAFCMLYFFRTLQQYDARLVQKQKELQVAKMELDQRYKETIQDLEGFLSQSLETEVTFAERGFDSHRRDFVRFLQKYREGGTAEADDGAALPTFCSFVRRWLRYFSEASIDPFNRPLEVVPSDEIDQCKTQVEVATLVSERLSSIEVQFVSTQREKDKEEVARVRSSWTTKSAMQKKALGFKELLCGRVPALHQSKESTGDLEEAAQPSTLSFEDDATKDSAVEEYRWVQWGESQKHFEHDPSKQDGDEETSSALPKQLNFGCVTIVLLSYEHIQLILSFFLGIAVLVLEGPILKGLKISLITETIICLMCIVFILHEFLDIDVVQQLDSQLRALEAAQLEVLQKRERIMSFYSSTQDLGDLWLHHTIPHLDLIKRFYDSLLDIPVEEHPGLINGMEEQLEALEQSIPPLEDWRGDSIVSEKSKKAFSNTISEFVRKNRGIKEALPLMPQCSRDVRIALGLETADPTTPTPVPDTSQNAADTSSGTAFKAGSAVEYWSKSRFRWIPARIIRVDPESGLLDLDYKNQVNPKSVRPISPEDQDSKCKQQ